MLVFPEGVSGLYTTGRTRYSEKFCGGGDRKDKRLDKSIDLLVEAESVNQILKPLA
jgi:hypothetical protein